MRKYMLDFIRNWPEPSPERPPLTPEDQVVVAVSGGPDSLALLHLLARQGLHPPENVIAAHLNHGWRPAAAAEANFVAGIAANWGLACVVESADVIGLARNQGRSLEEAGRQARYRFLARVSEENGATFIATGHNADDQAETVLMHFLRGSGLAGLRGMLPVSPLPEADATSRPLTLIRPLLAASRAEILAYCQRHGLAPIQDSSNLDVSFWRNRLRHELLPHLADYNPQIKERLQDTAALLAADHELLQGLLEQAWLVLLQDSGQDWLRLDRAAWLAQPISLRRSALRQAARQLRSSIRDLSFRTIEQARQVAETGQVGAQSALPEQLVLTVDYESLQIAAAAAGPPVNLPQLPGDQPLALPVPGRVALTAGWTIETTRLEAIDLAAIQANKDPWLAFVDAARVGDLVVRPRLRGETFQPLGMQGQSARVKEVMINRKIPARLRERWPIVADQAGLVWLVGHHLDERARVTARSRQVLQLRAVKNFLLPDGPESFPQSTS